jgi:sortase (surface protein transpeptidase)
LGRFSYPAAGIKRTFRKYNCRWDVLPRGLYEWKCRNDMNGSNRLILAHAYDALKPMMVAQQKHRLKVGQKATLTVGRKTSTYRVEWIRVVPKSGVYKGKDAPVWAYGNTKYRAITLWTCYGSKSQSRLVVRLRLI